MTLNLTYWTIFDKSSQMKLTIPIFDSNVKKQAVENTNINLSKSLDIFNCMLI
jgi:hypothetical protein